LPQVVILLFEVIPTSIVLTVSVTIRWQQEEHISNPTTAREEDEHIIAIPTTVLDLLLDRKSTNIRKYQKKIKMNIISKSD
jgi:hypothetical protein